MTKLFKALSLRISLIFSLFTIIILIIMGLMIHQLVMKHFEQQDRTQLEGKVELIQNLLQLNPQNDAFLLTQLDDALVGHHGMMVQVERPIGQMILNTAPAKMAVQHRQHSSHAAVPLTEWQIHDETYRGLIVSHPATAFSQSNRIVVGIDTKEHMLFMDQFREQLLIIGSAGTVALMVLGWFAAWRGLRPAQTMAKVAEGISAQHLTGRLDVNNTPSELTSLAIAFNDMLDRLESALARLSDFSSDLAHELRTPINNLMTQTQVCLSRPRDLTSYQDVLFSNLEEFERLARMISDMLFLAKAEHGLSLPHLQHIDVKHEVDALFEFYDALAAEKGMILSQSGTAHVQGDPLMLRRALSNLLSNAIRYGKKDTPIEITLDEQVQTTTITVKNEAATISPEQQSRLFDRFYRTDASRQRTDDGTGLGLAITKSIIDAHGASIDVQSDNDLVVFIICFPHRI